jgi:hypothetical protein
MTVLAAAALGGHGVLLWGPVVLAAGIAGAKRWARWDDERHGRIRR